MNFREYLDTHEKLVYTNKGGSMLPMIKEGRDLVVIKKKGEARLKKYDVAMYEREPGHYILHRVIAVKDDSYIMRGDNNYFKEYGIKDSDILGVLTGFIRKGTEHSVTEPKYKLYYHVWHCIYPARWLWKNRPALLKRIKILGKA